MGSSSPPLRRLRPDDDDADKGRFVSDDGVRDLRPQSPTRTWESDRTISDDDDDVSPASVLRTEPNERVVGVDGGWATTGKRSRSTEGKQAATAAPAAKQLPRPVPPPRDDQAPLKYTCKDCGRSYAKFRALGGHVSLHRIREREAAAAAAAAAGTGARDGGALAHRGRKSEGRTHVCRKCGKVFSKGTALGGHMRAHAGDAAVAPVVPEGNKKRCLEPAVDDFVASSTPGLSSAAPIMPEGNKKRCHEPAVDDVAAPPTAGVSSAAPIKTEEASSPAPVRSGRVLLFGVDISRPPV